MGADHGIRLLEDRVLVDRARRGEAAAFEELYRRHAAAAWRLAWAVVPRSDLAAGAVIHGMASTLAGPGVAPQLASGMRLPILAATRHAALDALERHRGDAVDPVEADDVVVTQADLAALHALPELWRATTWLVEVEGASPGDAALVLGVARSGAALATRAGLGLRQQVLTAGAAAPAPCRRAIDRLAAYAAGSLAPRDEARIRAHLDGCQPCRDRLASLDDLPLRLRAAIPSLPVALADAAERRWTASLVRETGPLRLVLPGGQPVPAWAERAVAGAAAAAVALGITAAVLAGGRNRSRTDDLARDGALDQPYRASDGEVALGGGRDEVFDVVLDTTAAPAGSGGAAASAADAAPEAPAPALSRSTNGTISGSTAPGTAGGTTTTTTPPQDEPTPPPPPPAPPEPTAQVTVGVGDAVAVTAGDACVGVELLGQTIGCEPTTTDDPVTVTTEGSLLSSLGL